MTTTVHGDGRAITKVRPSKRIKLMHWEWRRLWSELGRKEPPLSLRKFARAMAAPTPATTDTAAIAKAAIARRWLASKGVRP